MNELKTANGMTVHIEKLEGNELIIREGAALPLKEPKVIIINGTIEAPRVFYLARIADLKFTSNHLLVDRNKMSITLNIEDKSFYQSTITGKLSLTEELGSFKINSQSGWSPRDFSEFAKMNRAFFSSREECNNLVTKLRDFKGKVETTIEKNDTNKGDRRLLIDKIVKTEIPDTIKLEIPVFKGQKPVSFIVELLVDARDVDLTLHLISPELNEYIQKIKDSIIDEEIQPFKTDGFAVIET